MATFAMMVGISGSGRTKYAREELEKKRGYLYVSSDYIGREFKTDSILSSRLQRAIAADMKDFMRRHGTSDSGIKEALQESVLFEFTLREACDRIRKGLLADRDVVWDGEHFLRGNRSLRIQLARSRYGADRVVCYWMNPPYDSCLRNISKKLGGIEIFRGHLMERKAKRQADKIEAPILAEGFDEIVEVTRYPAK